MEIKKIINLFRKAEGYIGLNAAYANEIAGFLEEYERRAENLVNHNADLNHRLSKAEFHIEMLEKQKEAMLKELCDKEDLVREAEGRFYELEKELDTLKNATKKQPETEWISVEDEPIPGEQSYIFTVLPKIIIKRNPVTGEPAYWMRLEPPKPKETTFRDVFLKAFPKAPLGYNGALKLCARNVFPQINCSLSNGCAECWKQTYFKGEGWEE